MVDIDADDELLSKILDSKKKNDVRALQRAQREGRLGENVSKSAANVKRSKKKVFRSRSESQLSSVRVYLNEPNNTDLKEEPSGSSKAESAAEVKIKDEPRQRSKSSSPRGTDYKTATITIDKPDRLNNPKRRSCPSIKKRSFLPYVGSRSKSHGSSNMHSFRNMERHSYPMPKRKEARICCKSNLRIGKENGSSKAKSAAEVTSKDESRQRVMSPEVSSRGTNYKTATITIDKPDKSNNLKRRSWPIIKKSSLSTYVGSRSKSHGPSTMNFRNMQRHSYPMPKRKEARICRKSNLCTVMENRRSKSHEFAIKEPISMRTFQKDTKRKSRIRSFLDIEPESTRSKSNSPRWEMKTNTSLNRSILERASSFENMESKEDKLTLMVIKNKTLKFASDTLKRALVSKPKKPE